MMNMILILLCICVYLSFNVFIYVRIKLLRVKMNTKHYTSNYKYILQGIYPEYCHIYEDYKIIEPFAGDCDLVNIFENCQYSLYDIDIDNCQYKIKKRDTLLNRPSYKNKFVITNPPYLARNKSDDKTIFNLYKTDDLYKCFIKSIKDVEGGILILPLNFITSIKRSDCELRGWFLDRFKILRLNIFQHKTFERTNISICSFIFVKRNTVKHRYSINTYLIDEDQSIKLRFYKKYNYIIGGQIYNLKGKTKVRRYVNDSNIDGYYFNNINLKCIDSNSDKIRIFKSNDIYGKISDRCYCTILMNIKLSKTQRDTIILKFNTVLNDYRERYNSLFLSSYREFQRKRISFTLAFNLLSYIVDEFINI